MQRGEESTQVDKIGEIYKLTQYNIVIISRNLLFYFNFCPAVYLHLIKNVFLEINYAENSIW